MSFLICHYVILSYKNHQFISVTLLFCLQKNICLSLSLCHYVFKKASVSLRHSVILSSKKHLSPFVIMSFCLQKKHLSPFVIMSFCLQKKHLSLSVTLLFCLKTPQLGTEAGPAVVVIVTFLSVLYQHFISCTTSSFTTFL